MMYQLRPYQVEAIASIEQEWEQGKRSTLLVLGTGLGKTTCFSEIARRERDRGGRTLVLAHRIELVSQAAARLESVGVSTQLESGASRASWMQWPIPSAVVATVQTLRGRRLKQWPRSHFTVIVIDEAHRSPANAYGDILAHFNNAHVLGVTATPDRADGVALGGVFESIAYDYGLVAGIDGGYLCDLRALEIPLDAINIDDVKVTKQEHGRDLNAAELAEKVNAESPMLSIASAIVEHTLAERRKTLVFMPSVETSHILAAKLAAHVGAHRVRSLDGTTDKVIRARVLEEFQRGDVDYLVNCALFTEGFDAPIVSCVAIVRPTKSRSLYAQMVGRGTRLFPGKSDCLVLNFAPINTRHDLASVVDIFDGKEMDKLTRADVNKALKEGASVREAQDKAKERSEARERRLAAERAKSNIIAKVSYTATPHALWTEQALGHKPAHYAAGIPLALPRQLETLRSFRIEPVPGETVASASAKIKAITARKRKGLCSIKQGAVLVRAGLNGDLPLRDARDAMDALAANGWKATDEMRSKWARKVATNG
jgi:superfamily II DNA or RNA helicase